MPPAFAVAAILFVAAAAPAQRAVYDEKVFLDNFDQRTGTYSGRVIVTYHLCTSDHFGNILTYNRVQALIAFAGARSSEDARAQNQAKVDAIIAEAQRSAQLCPPP